MSKVVRDQLIKGEINQFSFDFAAAVSRLGTSVSSAAWEADSNSVSLGAESLTSNVASVLITGSSEGCAYAKCTATLADGQKLIRKIHITVVDPDCDESGGRY